MSLLPSLLRAIVQMDGDSLVLHAGERPYVVSEAGQVELAATGITPEAIAGVIEQLMPADTRRALSEFGRAQHELIDVPDLPGERFHVAASNAGGGLSVEIRRHGTPAAASASQAPGRRRRTDRRRPSMRLDENEASPGEEPALPVPSLPLPPQPDIDSAAPRDAGRDLLDRVLRAAIAEGATRLYLVSGSRPWVRVDDDVHVLEGAAALDPGDIEAMLGRPPNAGATAVGDPREWVWAFPDLGQVRCTSFRDQGGQGLVLRPLPIRPLTSHQLGLSAELEALTARSEGLIVVAGSQPRGRRLLSAALVDLINRTRRLHVITVEREVTVAHQREGSFVSQREAGRGLDRMLDAARSALREEPDVLVIESAQSAGLLLMALEAASSGRLVICGFPGDSPASVIEEMVGQAPPDRRHAVHLALARALLAVVVQPRGAPADTGAGSAPPLVLLNSPDVAALIAEGRMAAISAPRTAPAPGP